MKRIHYWLILFLVLVVLIFNTSYYLNTAVSRKYEVDHPRITHGNDESIEQREKTLNLHFNIIIIIYIICVFGLGGSVIGIINSNNKY